MAADDALEVPGFLCYVEFNDMRRFLSILLIASSLLFASTFAGMAIFGMGAVAHGNHGACIGASCDAMPNDASGARCVDHCLSAMPSGNPDAPMLLAALFAVLAAFFLVYRIDDVARLFPAFRRLLTDIGKHLLHQNLSTIVLRN